MTTEYEFEGEQPLCENALSTTHLGLWAFFTEVLGGIHFSRVTKSGRPIVTLDPRKGGLL